MSKKSTTAWGRRVGNTLAVNCWMTVHLQVYLRTGKHEASSQAEDPRLQWAVALVFLFLLHAPREKLYGRNQIMIITVSLKKLKLENADL